MSSGLLTLPTEIHAAIIDCHHNDRETLLSCTQVCRLWLELARSNLFAEITISSNNALGFAALSTSTLAIIRQSMARLEIKLGMDDSGHLIEPTMAALAGDVPLNLTVYLDNVEAYTPYLPPNSPTLLTISELQVGYQETGIGSDERVVEFLQSLPRLERLWLDVKSRLRETTVLPLPNCLRTLCVTCADWSLGDELKKMLFDGLVPRTPPLQALHLEPVETSDVTSAVIRSLGESLKHLSFYGFWRDVNWGIDLRRHTELRSLRVWFDHEDQIRQVVDMLLGLPSVHFHSIILRYMHFTPNVLSSWAQLDGILTGDKFPRGVTVYLETDYPEEDVRALLPSSWARGIVRITDPLEVEKSIQRWLDFIRTADD